MRPRDVGDRAFAPAPSAEAPWASATQYVAWSAADRRLTLLGGREDAVEVRMCVLGGGVCVWVCDV